jgi:hypothetical protein
MSLLESADLQARDDIVKLNKEQYAQSELIKTAREAFVKHEAKIEGQVANLEQRFIGCDNKHDSHNKHRRQSDLEMATIATTLNETLAVNKQTQVTLSETQTTLAELLTIVRAHTKTVDRTADSYTTIDGVKGFFIYAASIAAGIYALKQVLDFFAP